MKVIKIRLKECISQGIGFIIPANPHRPDIEMETHDKGILIKNLKTGVFSITPYENILEFFVENPKGGRPKKSETAE